MKSGVLILVSFFSFSVFAQDSTMNKLTKGMNTQPSDEKKSVKIFSTGRTVNANTTQMVGKGKMDFKVTHNFGDIGGTNGGVKTFFGLDAITDLRIAFHVGLTDRLDVNVARVKGAGTINQLYELALKYKLMDQLENDPSHPFAIALFANTTISARNASATANLENSFGSVSDRMSQTIQLIIARKFQKVSLQINPTFVHTNYVIKNDDNGIFALGGAIRFPVTRNFNIIVDYFHPFRSQSSKNFFKDTTGGRTPINFYDPIGISFEIITLGHVFNLNFTNATEILENRFIPRTVTNWGDGQFRWGFTISRTFVLWKEKGK